MTEVIGLLIAPLIIMMLFILVSERFVAALGSIAASIKELLP